ncbi:MAG: hypothetical protein AABX13_05865 [Nanoarchaeota archaeon]
MKRASDLYLKDILVGIERIKKYTFNLDLEDFSQNTFIVVAHKYWKINFIRIWDILENKLDTLEKQVHHILEKEFS